jgi:hypothetical protein
MAYNQRSFETIYGFSILDELHNFFPELLYDNRIFQSEIIQWMRSRINQLFPEAFVRQQHLYNIYNAHDRRHSFLQWRNENTDLPQQIPHTPSRTATTATITPSVQRARQSELHSPHVRRQTNVFDISGSLPTLFTSLFLDMPLQGPFTQITPTPNLLHTLNTLFQDVPIVPTSEEIDRASRVLNNSDVPEETVCSICQEHGSEYPWRILHCSHMYHRPCIDRWFTSHVQCPVCRADVRTMRHP